MNPDLKNAIAPLLQALEEYERHHREAIANSYHTPYSLSAFVPVDANDLRRLRDAVAASGDAIESTANVCGIAIEIEHKPLSVDPLKTIPYRLDC